MLEYCRPCVSLLSFLHQVLCDKIQYTFFCKKVFTLIGVIYEFSLFYQVLSKNGRLRGRAVFTVSDVIWGEMYAEGYLHPTGPVLKLS